MSSHWQAEFGNFHVLFAAFLYAGIGRFVIGKAVCLLVSLKILFGVENDSLRSHIAI